MKIFSIFRSVSYIFIKAYSNYYFALFNEKCSCKFLGKRYQSIRGRFQFRIYCKNNPKAWLGYALESCGERKLHMSFLILSFHMFQYVNFNLYHTGHQCKSITNLKIFSNIYKYTKAMERH